MRTGVPKAVLFGILLDLAVASAGRAQSVDIPLQLANAGDGVILVINVGIGEQKPQPYLFDTGSGVFNVDYTAAAFGNIPSNMSSSGLPTGLLYKYGDSNANNDYYVNIVGVPSLTFYQSATSPSGETINAVTSSGASSNFLIGAVYSHIDSNGNNVNLSQPLQASSSFSGYYGIFGADTLAASLSGNATRTQNTEPGVTPNTSTVVVGGVLGQAVIPATTAGYVVAANGQTLTALEASSGSSIAGASTNGPQVGQNVTTCSPCVMLGLTPALLAQFTSTNTLAATTTNGNSFPNSGAPSLDHFAISMTVTLSDGVHAPYTITQPTLLDTGTADNNIYSATADPRAYTTYTSEAIDNNNPEDSYYYYFVHSGVTLSASSPSSPSSGASSTSYTVYHTGPYSVDTGVVEAETLQQTILGVSFFLQNSVLFNLAGEAIGYTPNFVTDADITTTTASPLVIDGTTSVPLGLAGVISGNGGVSVVDGGSATLSGTNTYTGATVIDDGYLAIAGPGSIAASIGVSVTTSGMFDISSATSNVTIATLSGDASGMVFLGAQSLILAKASTTFNGIIGGSGGLILLGGTETLAGSNTYSGETLVLGGTLVVTGDISPSSGVAIGAGGMLQIGNGGASGSFAGNVLDDGVFAIDRSDTFTFAGVVSGTGSFVQAGSGTTVLRGANAYSGSTIVSAGTLQAGAASTFSPASAFAIVSGATLDLHGFSQTIGSLAGAGNVNLGSATLTTGNDNTSTTFSGVIAGQGGLTKIGTGTFVLAGSDTYSGGTTLTGGTLGIANSQALGSGALTMAAGTTLQFAASGLTIANAIALPSAAPTIDTGGNSVMLSGVISGSGGLTKIGTGLLDLAGKNTYSGGTTLTGGTLGIGNSQALGSGALTMAAGTTLQFAASGLTVANAIVSSGAAPTIDTGANSVTLSGVISGPGGLTKIGAGLLDLAGANTYTGATIVTGGTLRIAGDISSSSGVTVATSATLQLGNGGAAGSFAGNVVDNGVFAIDRSDTFTFAGAISGTGSFVQAGSGTIILAGANAYSGSTTISAGMLQAGATSTFSPASAVTIASGAILDLRGFSQTVGSLAGAGQVALGSASLTTGNDNTSTTFSGVIAGQGGLTKIGTGTFVLAGSDTYSGGTTLSGGALGIANSQALGTGALTMAAGTSLQFAASGLDIANRIVFPNADPTIDTGANSVTISGPISGPGSLTKIGTGVLDLTGTNTYTGATIVATGTLVVDGSIAASSSLTVDPGATLAGTGTLPGLTVLAGASVAPGATVPFSTLATAGPVSFLAGSTYIVDVDATGRSDRIVTTGTATLSSAAAVTIVGAPVAYSARTTYTILTAQGGVGGTFGTVTATSNLAFLQPQLSYDAQDVYLDFVQKASPVAFSSVAVTANQVAVANAVQSLDPASALYSFAAGQTAAGARQSFGSFAGDIHASAVSAVFDDTRLPREAVLDRLTSAIGEPGAIHGTDLPSFALTTWGQGFGSFGRTGGNGNAATLDRSLGGFILGADTLLGDRYRVGVTGGYTQSFLSATAESGHIDTTYIGLYGGTSFQALQLRAGATYGYNRYNVDRGIAFPGFVDAAGGGYGGDTFQAFTEAGWRIPLTKANFVEPFVGVLAMHIDTNAFHEFGGAAALNGSSGSYDDAASTLGVRAEAGLPGDLPLLVRGMLGWRHVFGNVTPRSDLAFESAPQIPFVISGVPIARDAAVVEAGFDWKLGAHATAGLIYSGALGGRDQDNAIKGKIEVDF